MPLSHRSPAWWPGRASWRARSGRWSATAGGGGSSSAASSRCCAAWCADTTGSSRSSGRRLAAWQVRRARTNGSGWTAGSTTTSRHQTYFRTDSRIRKVSPNIDIIFEVGISILLYIESMTVFNQRSIQVDEDRFLYIFVVFKLDPVRWLVDKYQRVAVR